MILAAQTCHKADAVQLQAAVRVLGQIPVAGAVEGLLCPCSHPLRQVAQTHALEHCVGKQGGAAGLQIVALGFLVAMVDVLERMDEQLYNEYRGIMAMLKQTIEDVHKFQDEETGMFWQVMDHPGVEGNYLETSGTALFAYAVLKGVRLGYLPKRMAAWAEKAFYGTCDKYLSKNPDGSLQLDGICLVAGLGGKDHRDGSLAYYFSEPVVCNDAKGVGPLVLAYTEMIARK